MGLRSIYSLTAQISFERNYFKERVSGEVGGGLWEYFPEQIFAYLNTSHLKYDFISKRTGPIYISKNI